MSAEISIKVMVQEYPNGEGSDLILVDDNRGMGVLLGSFFELNDGSFRCSGQYFARNTTCQSIGDAIKLGATNYLSCQPVEVREIEEGSPEEMEFYREICDHEPEESGKLGIFFILAAILYSWWWMR